MGQAPNSSAKGLALAKQVASVVKPVSPSSLQLGSDRSIREQHASNVAKAADLCRPLLPQKSETLHAKTAMQSNEKRLPLHPQGKPAAGRPAIWSIP